MEKPMRATVLAAFCAAALWQSPATANTIVQTVSGTSRTPGAFNLFDPSFGTLDSVQIEGTVSFSEDLIRNGDPATFQAINIPAETTIFLLHGPPSQTAASAAASGTEVWAAFSSFGHISLSGNLFALLTGSDVNQFLIVGGGPSTDVLSPSGSVASMNGQLLGNPGSPLATFSGTLTYSYMAVPEPSAWDMMLMGFAGIGLALRRRPRLFCPNAA
jgi:hypothetical protein